MGDGGEGWGVEWELSLRSLLYKQRLRYALSYVSFIVYVYGERTLFYDINKTAPK